MRPRSAALWVVLLFVLLPGGAVAGQPDPLFSDALWVAGASGLSKMAPGGGALWEALETGNARAVAIDARRATVWVYAERNLHAFGFDGARRLTIAVPSPATEHSHLAVHEADGSVWLAAGKDLASFSAAGQRLVSLRWSEEVRALSTDVGRGLLWVGGAAQAVALDAVTGDRVQALPGLQDLDADPAGGIWAALRDRLRRHGPDGSLLLDLPVDGLLRVVADRRGGAWAATAKELRRVNASGATVASVLPFGGRGAVTALAADPGDGSVWVASHQDLAQVSAAGEVVRIVELRPSAQVRDLAFYTDLIPPELAVAAPAAGELLSTRTPTIEVLWADAGIGVDAASLEVRVDGAPLGVSCDDREDGATCAPAEALADGEHALAAVVRDFAGNRAEAAVSFTVDVRSEEEPPPDPATVAPPVDPTVATDIAAATEFLYAGPRPIQTGVAPGTLEPGRVAVLRGRVIDREGNPLAGARIILLGHPELGRTLSREDGLFDLAVNGGGILTLQYEKDGYLPSQRPVEVPWRDYLWVEEVALIPFDTAATVVSAGAPELQVARANAVTDGDGTRRTTLLFPAGTQAEMVLPDGSRQPLPSMTVRATEYTVGPNGPASMPGALPPSVGYTYAVELSVDEAVAAGAERVVFSRPVVHYVENFLRFPVGEAVPTGYYDRRQAAWIAADDGRIVKILSVTEGLADLDVTGNGQPADAWTLSSVGVSDEERAQLALLYSPGQSLWRVPIPHFTPYDCNWTVGLPGDAAPPRNVSPETDEPEDESCEQPGSIIECQNQTLGESIPVVGTPFRLGYRSSRVPGRKSLDTVVVTLSGPSVPPSLRRIELEIQIAGQRHTWTFPGAPDQRHTFSWDGKDVFGRSVAGRQRATVAVGYVYDLVYYRATSSGLLNASRSWAQVSGFPFSEAREEITVWQRSEVRLGSWHVPPAELGGWTLSPQHAYDEDGRFLFLGTGEKFHADPSDRVVQEAAGRKQLSGFSGDGGPATAALLYSPQGVAAGPDGSLYIADRGNLRVRRVGPDGTIRTVAGNPTCTGYCGPGNPATQARLYAPQDVAVAPDGSLFIADYDAIHKVDPAGIFHTVYYGSAVYGIDVDRQGNLYVAEYEQSRVLRIEPDRRVVPVAGTGVAGFNGDGGQALQTRLRGPLDVAVDSQGNLYIADFGNNRIRKVGVDGIVTTYAGNGAPLNTGDGGAATTAAVVVGRLALGADGSLYVAAGYQVRRISPNGVITTAAGSGGWGDEGDGGPAAAATFREIDSVAVAPDGSLYLSDSQNNRVRNVASPLPGFSQRSIKVASRNGRELYLFDEKGRHLRTTDTLTGVVLYDLSYNATGLLTSIRDRDGQDTRIERDGAGRPTAIVAPFGQRTALTVDGNGWLASITNPAGETVRLRHGATGLLLSLTDAKGQTYDFEYDPLGRLLRDEDPAGGYKALTRTPTASGYRIGLTTGEGRSLSYLVEKLPAGGTRWLDTTTAGLQEEVLFRADESRRVTHPDGTVVSVVLGPDPRFGMTSPVVSSLQVRTPAGLTSTATRSRTVTLENPADPMSRLLGFQESLTWNGKTFVRSYDVAQRKFTFTTAAGRRAEVTVDALGRPATAQFGGLAPLSFAFDGQGRLTSVSQGSGAEQRSFAVGYAAAGWLASLTDPLTRTVAFEHDDAGRVLRQTLPGQREIGFAFDDNGNVTSITPPGRPAHAFDYTAVNLEQEYTPPALDDAGSTAYRYNRDGDVTRVERPDGGAVDLRYDSAGRLGSFVLGRGQVTYSYHPSRGALAGILAPGEALAYTWDGFLLTRVAWSGMVTGRVDHTYNSNFQVAAQTVNGAVPIAFQYDADGLLTKAGDLTLTLDPQNGLVIGTTLGGVTTTHGYDGFGQSAGIEARHGTTALYAATYTRDKLGRITSKAETLGGITDTYGYVYDPAGRLTEVTRNGAILDGYGYDANGNRTSFTSPSGAVVATYDVQDRLLQYGDLTYTYTANGELVAKTQNGQTVRYKYDELGNLLEVELPEGIRIEDVIDGQNRRVGKKVNGVLMRGWLYEDQLRPIAELDGAGNVVARFIYGSRPNVPDYMLRGGARHRILADHLGSPRLVVDAATGQIAQRLDYDAFGRVLLDTNPGFQPFGFAGGLYDPQTRLVRFGARDYDSEVGRWTAKDPIRFGGGDSNLYGYVLGDPVNLLDPDGRDVKNNCGCTIYVKPSETHMDGRPNVEEIEPNAVYRGKQDGIAIPSRPGEVFKSTNGIDLIVDPGGVVSFEYNIPFFFAGQFALQAVLGGWKGRDFLEERHQLKDFGWDDLFSKVAPVPKGKRVPNCR